MESSGYSFEVQHSENRARSFFPPTRELCHSTTGIETSDPLGRLSVWICASSRTLAARRCKILILRRGTLDQLITINSAILLRTSYFDKTCLLKDLV